MAGSREEAGVVIEPHAPVTVSIHAIKAWTVPRR